MEGDVIGLQNEIKAMARVALWPRPELSGIRERKRIIAKILNEMNGIPEEQLE